MSERIERPNKLIEDHLYFLDDLRESGVTNMFGASPYLKNEFSELTEKECSKILTYWMKTFSRKERKDE
jgi:hypothetical protein